MCFFWLKNPESEEDLKKLITGVKSLAKIKFVKKLIVGIPPKTEKRKVIDNSYAVSKLIFLKVLNIKSLLETPVTQKICKRMWTYCGQSD